MKVTVKDNFTKRAAGLIASRASKAENIVAEKVAADTEPFVPFLTGTLAKQTRVVGNTVIYSAPYVRYLYYGKVMVDSATGKGAMHYIGKDGNEYFRFRKGAVLKPTDRPLKYTKDYHKNAGSAWIERSRAQNEEKWMDLAKRVINYGE